MRRTPAFFLKPNKLRFSCYKLGNSQQNRESCDSVKALSNFSSKQFEKENQSLKRPALMIQDCENNTDEDFSSNQLLYDYSTWDAWYESFIYYLLYV